MPKHHDLGRSFDIRRTFSSEGDRHFVGHHQNIDPVIKRREQIAEIATSTPRNSTDRRHVASIPSSMLVDWLKKTGHTMHEWATNAGGDPYSYRVGGPGVKDQFATHFLSRDYSKLHNQHTTTRAESGMIVVPKSIERSAVSLEGIGNGKSGRPEG